MKARDFQYHRPGTVDEAILLLSKHENSRVLAGGQSLMPMLNLRIASPEHLIDLGGIAALCGIEDHDQHIHIGSMTTQRDVQRSRLVEREAPLLREAIDLVGHQQTRNRGTIGGSLCHLDPGAELPVIAAAMDVTMVVQGPRGLRRIPFSDFPIGYLTSCLDADEILTGIEVPKLARQAASAFVEFTRRPADFAIVSAAVLIRLNAEGLIIESAIAIGGSFPAPVRLNEAEQLLSGRKPDDDVFAAAAALARDVPCDGDDLYPEDYRRELAQTLVQRALSLAASRIGSDACV